MVAEVFYHYVTILISKHISLMILSVIGLITQNGAYFWDLGLSWPVTIRFYGAST